MQEKSKHWKSLLFAIQYPYFWFSLLCLSTQSLMHTSVDRIYISLGENVKMFLQKQHKQLSSKYEVCNVFRQFYGMQICTLHLSFMCIAHADTFTEETVTVIGILQSKRVSTFPDCCQVELYLDRPCHHCVLTLRLKPRRTSKTLKEEMQTLVRAFVLHSK